MVYSRRTTEGKQNLGASYNIKGKARELRKKLTVSEKILWSKLRRRQQNGMHFRKQHPYNIYILDFYCFDANLVIEVDGEIHLNRMEYDRERTKFLESSGLREIRFKNSDIETRMDWVLEIINNHFVKINSSDNDSPRVEIETQQSLSPLGETGKGVSNEALS